VARYRAHVQQKIRLTSRAELVHHALEHGPVAV
jgi:DNA-binding CsgD family transcriptional regulator